MARKRKNLKELEFRKHILKERKNKENKNIINKIDRKITSYNTDKIEIEF